MEDVFQINEIIPITLRPEMEKKVTLSSIVTLKNPEGKVIRVKFSRTQTTHHVKPENDGLITVYEKSPLALSIMGRTVGEFCQLGMLEIYYEILKIE